MHTSMIHGIDVDAGERFLVSASDDKTARVWDLATGKLLQILRPPEGDGNEGKLYSVAISPDGSTIAVSGFTGGYGHWSIYLFDRSTGSLVKRLGELANVAEHLAFSKDGSFLVASLGGANGIRVFRTIDYQQIASDVGYGMRPIGPSSIVQGVF